MGVVQLDRDLVGEIRPIVILLQMAAQDVLQRSGREEEFLAQAQFLAGGVAIGRIENAGQAFSALLLSRSAPMWSPALKASSRIGSIGCADQRRSVLTRLARQPTTGVSKAAAMTRSAGFQTQARPVIVAADEFDGAAETDFVGALLTLEFPGIAVGEPGFRQLHLPAVGHLLAEQAVDITNAVTIGRDV